MLDGFLPAVRIESSAVDRGSAMRQCVPPPSDRAPAARWCQPPAARCGAGCLGGAAPRAGLASRTPCPRAASRGAFAAGPASDVPAPWRQCSAASSGHRARGRRSVRSRAGCRGRRPPDGASCPTSLDLSDSSRFAPPFWRRHGKGINRGAAPIELGCIREPRAQEPVQLVPDACLLPFAPPSPAGGARSAAHLLGQPGPGASCPQDKDDAAQHVTVSDAGAASFGVSRGGRQQWFHNGPALVAHDRFGHHERCYQ